MNNNPLPVTNVPLAYDGLNMTFFVLALLFSSISVILGCGTGTEETAQESAPDVADSPREVAAETASTSGKPSIDHQDEALPKPVQAVIGRESKSENMDSALEKPSELTRASSQSLVDNSGEKLTVAILEFEDTSPGDEFARIDRALQSMLTTDLSVSRDLELVERARLEDVRKELNLVKTGFLDPKTAARIGKGVGAKAILTGSFWVRDKKMRIDARLVHVETGTVILAEEITGLANEFNGLEKQLAGKVLDAAGVHLSALETADLSKRHTSSLSAASHYGKALNAEDAGDVDESRRNAAAALEVDPEFALAEQLFKQLGELLDRARGDDLRQKISIITRFEDNLNGHPFGNPQFKPVDYPQLSREEGPDRALLYWVSRLGTNPMEIASSDPYDLLFADPDPIRSDSGTITRMYLELGGAEPVLFWCDVGTSEPKYTPTMPLTEDMLNPDLLSRPIWGPYPSYFYWRLPDLFDKRFEAEAWIRGDFEKAMATIELAHRICGPLVSEAAYRRHLEELNDVISSPRQLSTKRKDVRERQQLWQLAHDQIVYHHAALQDSRFGPIEHSSDELDMDEVRLELLHEYAVFMPGGRAAQERQAKHIVDDLLKEADGAKFVARKTLVPNDSNELEFLMLMHLSGCPYSYLSDNERLGSGLPVQTVLDEEIDSGLEKVHDLSEGIQRGWIPCPHCRPFRWANDVVVQHYLAERLPQVIDRFINNETASAQVELKDLLIAFQDDPTTDARASLRRLSEHVCKEALGDRTLHATALQCMSRVTTSDDASWLITLLETTPWWDVRINVAAALATIADDAVLTGLSNTIQQEQYYFVRHGLEAARARAQESLFRVRLPDSVTEKDAERILESLLNEVEGNKYLTSAMRLRWKSPLHSLMRLIGKERGDLDFELQHLRRVVELNPDDAEYKNDLGYTLATYGRSLDEAEQVLREAIALDTQKKLEAGKPHSGNPMYLDSLGFVFFKQGRFAMAKDFVTRSLDSPDGQVLEIYDHLGDIHLALGEKKEAIAAWKKAIEVATATPFEQELKTTVVKKINEQNTP